MAAMNGFRREQRGVAIRMIVALCVTILVSAACLHWAKDASRPLTMRLVFAAQADVFVICWLAASIGNVAMSHDCCASSQCKI